MFSLHGPAPQCIGTIKANSPFRYHIALLCHVNDSEATHLCQILTTVWTVIVIDKPPTPCVALYLPYYSQTSATNLSAAPWLPSFITASYYNKNASPVFGIIDYPSISLSTLHGPWTAPQTPICLHQQEHERPPTLLVSEYTRMVMSSTALIGRVRSPLTRQLSARH